MNEEILTTFEAVRYFKTSKKTLIRLIHEGKVRAFKIGNGYRFKKSDLEEDLKVNKN